MIDIAIPRAAAEPRATVLVLRCCRADRVASKGFVWPESGPVACDDWSPEKVCGQGLHGWLWGAGDLRASNGSHEQADAKWFVVEVDAGEVVDLDGKVKFPRGEVLYCGDRDTAVKMIAARAPAGIAAMWATVTGGYGATVTGGDGATVTGGDRATVTGGNRATVTGGYGATVTGGDGATVTGGYGATVTGGDRATVTGGDRATVSIEYWCSKRERWRRAIAEVGEDGIEPNTAYILDENNKFAKKPTEAKAAQS